MRENHEIPNKGKPPASEQTKRPIETFVADYQKRSGVAVQPVSAILSSSATTHLRLVRSLRTDRKRTYRRTRHV